MGAKRQKVIVAMSGGVDSSVAAASLVRAGYDVTGIFMCLGTAGGGADAESRGCCSPQDAADARRVAEQLGIPLYVLNFTDAFGRIVDYFISEYAHGRTPNPCIHCNAMIKFGRLIEYADSLGAAFVATGHYARVERSPAGPLIARACNVDKDQSYALFGVARSNLPRMLLPIGDIKDKAAVRRTARSLGLAVHDKPDSQETCFVADDDYVGLLRTRLPSALKPGEVVDSAGKVLGQHDGFARFTIGQRKGLGLAMGVPYYVTKIDPATAQVTIGPKEETLSSHLHAGGANWHADPPAGQFEAIVQIRYNHRGAPGLVRLGDGGTFEVDFAQPVSAVTPGQAAVVYDGARMLGGGWID